MSRTAPRGPDAGVVRRSRRGPSAARPPERPSGGRAAVRATVLALLALVLLPAAAGAHGGILLASTIAGPYRTQVTAAPLVERGKPPAIDVTVYLSTVDANTPISGATVRTTVVADGRTVRPAVREIAGGYEAVVPVKNAFTVGKQRIDVRISGPRGTGRVTIDPTDGDGGGPPVALLVGTAVVLVLLVLLVVRVRRGRGGTRGDREDRWDDDVWEDDEVAPGDDEAEDGDGGSRHDAGVAGDRVPRGVDAERSG